MNFGFVEINDDIVTLMNENGEQAKLTLNKFENPYENIGIFIGYDITTKVKKREIIDMMLIMHYLGWKDIKCPNGVRTVKMIWNLLHTQLRMLYPDFNKFMHLNSYLISKKRFFDNQKPVKLNITDCVKIIDNANDSDERDKMIIKKMNTFMICEENGYVSQKMKGFSTSLRWNIGNPLTGLLKNEGNDNRCRRVITVPSGKTMCRIDMKSLEERTKWHYLAIFDESIKYKADDDNFDPYIDLARNANLISFYEGYAWEHGYRTDKVVKAREIAKTAMMGMNYGSGIAKLTEKIGDENIARKIYNAYKHTRETIQHVNNVTKKKYVENILWILNPVSKIWYRIDKEKDMFHTLNNSTGVYVFDTFCNYLSKFKSDDMDFLMQFHDEIIFQFNKGNENKIERIAKKAIKESNNILNLNVSMKIDISFGENYSELH